MEKDETRAHSGKKIVAHGILYGIHVVVNSDGELEPQSWFGNYALKALLPVLGWDGWVFLFDETEESYWSALWTWLTDSEAYRDE